MWTLKDRVEELVAVTLEGEWFDDTHGRGKHPLCCELIDTILATIEGFTRAAPRDA